MILKEINSTLTLVWSHTVARLCFLLIIFISLLLSIFLSIFSSFIIIISYICGIIVSFFLLKYRYEVGFCLQRVARLYHGHITPKKKNKKSCNICDNSNCKRHTNEPRKEPWKHLYISKDLNTAIENFYNKILNNFVTSWYSNFTDDTAFLDELRTSVRFATANLVHRYLEIDVGDVIANKLIPIAVKHIDDCTLIEAKADKKNLRIEQVAISHFGRKLHAAVTNRENELEYLRQLTNTLMPNILSKSNLKCKNFNFLIREIIAGWVFLPLMDVIADPNILNLLVNLTINYKKKQYGRSASRSNEKVALLCNFTNYNNVKTAALGYDLTKILKYPEILYAFMQFLKDEGPVNILQFCLDVDEFNRKLLTPELSKHDLDKLHTEATKLFSLYLQQTSPDYIGCSSDISISFEYLLMGGPNNIPKFRTSTPLYKAYDFAFNILENEWLPLFFHNDEFYKLACGSKISSNYKKSPANRISKKLIEPTNQGTVSKLSSGFTKIKGALRTQPIEGAMFPAEPQPYESNSTIFIEQNTNRDLSCWRVSITQVEQGIMGSKTVSMFYINVKRIDSCSENERYWTVHRYDQDFHTLKLKLIEFHGENEICNSPLPSRRSTTPIETRRQKYEEFLQKLLQKPSLRGSDLLYTFLTTKQNFTLLADTSVPIVSDLENIYQSVAHKLRKERGQKLEPFMASFLASTETGQLKLKYENPDLGEEANSELLIEKGSKVKPRNLQGSIFRNNFGISLPDDIVYTPSTFKPRDITDSLLYILKNILHAPSGILQMYNAISNVASQAVDYFSRSLIEKGLKWALPEYTLAQLITLLQDVLFCEKSVPVTEFELEQRKINAFNNLAKLNRGYLCHLLGLDINTGLVNILKILQHPHLNKQLAYTFLDILVLELFPECNLNN